MKRNIKPFLCLFATVCLLIGAAWGCQSKLQQGGAYAPDPVGTVTNAPDKAFFIVEGSYDIAYSAIDAVFLFEKNNREMLWKISPDIKHTLDKIRPQAVLVRNEYDAARKAYMANPTPAGLSTLQAVLAKVQQLSTTATAVLPK